MDTLISALEAGPKRNGDQTDQEKIDAVLNHPLFMERQMNDDDLETETAKALQSLVFDGTPEEMAENFKVQGNSCYAAGRKKFKDAIEFYTKGIATGCQDLELMSILHSNRAAVNLELQNFRSVLYDCGRAIKLNSKNIKAYFRSIKALLALDRIEEGIDCCRIALEIDPNNKAIATEQTKLEQRGEELKELKKLEAIKEAKKKKISDELQAAIDSRNYNMIEKLDDEDEKITFQHPDAGMNRIELLPDGELTFPVLLLYPEFNQSDLISAFAENDPFYAHFENMFSEPSPWDPEFRYNFQNLDWYYVTMPSKGEPRLVSVLKSVKATGAPSDSPAHRYVYTTLKDCLKQPDFPIVNGMATFIIFSRNSEYGQKYRKQFQA